MQQVCCSLTYLVEKGKKLDNQITTGKRSCFIFQPGKGFIEMQLIYLADIFENNYNIVRDRFETESASVMKYIQRNKGNFNILAWLSLSDNHENCY